MEPIQVVYSPIHEKDTASQIKHISKSFQIVVQSSASASTFLKSDLDLNLVQFMKTFLNKKNLSSNSRVVEGVEAVDFHHFRFQCYFDCFFFIYFTLTVSAPTSDSMKNSRFRRFCFQLPLPHHFHHWFVQPTTSPKSNASSFQYRDLQFDHKRKSLAKLLQMIHSKEVKL